MPAKELLDWLAYDKAKARGGPTQTPEMMRAELRRVVMNQKIQRAR